MHCYLDMSNTARFDLEFTVNLDLQNPPQEVQRYCWYSLVFVKVLPASTKSVERQRVHCISSLSVKAARLGWKG